MWKRLVCGVAKSYCRSDITANKSVGKLTIRQNVTRHLDLGAVIEILRDMRRCQMCTDARNGVCFLTTSKQPNLTRLNLSKPNLTSRLSVHLVTCSLFSYGIVACRPGF